MKCMVFASRNFKEIIRDPLSWIFCVGFPIVMLVIMTVINNSIPAQAGMTLFELPKLVPGIIVFGFTFITLFTSLLVSGDRKDAFLLRIYTSPMRSSDYIIGYILPLVLLAFCQCILTVVVGLLMGIGHDFSISLKGILLLIVSSIPTVLMLVGFGLMFGALLNYNAAPGVSSVIITFSGMLGGIWMDVEAIGGTLGKICNALPFCHSVQAARYAFSGEASACFEQTGIVLIWAAAVLVIAVLVYGAKMKF